jgi:hypothetical protein
MSEIAEKTFASELEPIKLDIMNITDLPPLRI